MLSEHEILELLDQLKIGSQQFANAESDPLINWPILIGGGLCLNLQTAAASEFARHPEQVSVSSGLSQTTVLGEICSRYRQVHHVTTGVADQTLLIAYDQDCLRLFPHLHQSYQRRTEIEFGATYAYDFSLAIAASLDPSMHSKSQNKSAVAFLPLDFDDTTRLSGGWQLTIHHGSLSGCFFIGLLDSMVEFSPSFQTPVCSHSVEICVRGEYVTRSVVTHEVAVGLDMPDSLKFVRREESIDFEVRDSCSTDVLLARQTNAQPARETDLSEDGYTGADLLVQKSLQLSVDDLYLLLVEALGNDALLYFRFDVSSLCNDAGGIERISSVRIPENTRMRCLSVNELPIRNADIVVEKGKFILKSRE